MIALHNKDFTTNYGTVSTVVEALVEEERNGLFELSFVLLNTDSLFKYIKEDNIVVANANDTLLNQKFRIYMTRKLMNNRVEVFARHISFDLMYDYVDSISFDNQSCEYALNQLFRQSNFSTHYRGYSDIINAQNYSMSMCNILEAIAGKEGSIIDTFGNGAELLRDNENIHVLNRRGWDNEVTIEYRKNITGFELEEDTTDLVTRIRPYAKYTKEGSSEEVLVKADYVDSSYINNYSHPFIRAIDYSDKFEDGEIPTVEKLVALANNEYRDNKVDIPKQNYKIEFVPLSKCVGYEAINDRISLCDIITIKDTRYGIDTQSKVIKCVFNVLKNRYESIELGEPKTSLGDIIGNGGNDTPQVGPPGPQGPPGQDGNIGDFPDSLPQVPILESKVYGFANIELLWSFENKVYYSYEVYASKEKGFTPNTFNRIHEGQTSTYMYQAKPNETWYFKVCAINSYGNRTGFSNEVEVATKKIDDMTNYFEEAAIGRAVVGSLTADYMEAGIIKGNWIDAKQLSVTDGNGKRTLDIDSFGNVNLDVASLNIRNEDINYLTTVNLIKNSNFTASPKNQLWDFWQSGTNANWYFHQHLGFPTGEGIGIQCGQGHNCTATSSVVPVVNGEYYTVSMDLLVEGNVDHAIIMIREIDNTGAYVNEHNFRYEKNFGGRTSNTFRVDNPNTKSIQVIIWHKGATVTTGQYVVVFFNRVQLQRGRSATGWQNAIDNEVSKNLATLKIESDRIESTVTGIQNDYVGQSQLTQTVDRFEYKFNNINAPNLVPNGNPRRNNTQGWTTSGDNCGFYMHHPGDWAGLWSTNTGWETFAFSPRIRLYNGGKYSISFFVMKEVNVESAEVYLIGSADENLNYDWVHSCTGQINDNNMRRIKQTVDIPGHIKYLRFRVDNDKNAHGGTQGGYVVWFGEFMVIEGEGIYPNKWYPANNEAFNNITSIDAEGVKVQHESGSFSRMNHKEFYQANENGDRTLAMRYGGFRQYAFPRNGNDARHYLGSLSSTTLSGLYGTTMFGSSNNAYLSFGFSEMSNDEQHTGLTSWLLMNHYDGNVGLPQGIHTYKHLHVRGGETHHGRPNFQYGIAFPYADNDSANSEVSYLTTSANTTPGQRSLFIFAADGLRLGVQNGGNYFGHKMQEDQSNARLNHECYGDWNMNNWAMRNVRVITSLEDKSLTLSERKLSYKRSSMPVMSTVELIQDRGEDYTIDISEDLCTCVVTIPNDIRYNIGKYDVSIIKYGRGDIWVSERCEDHFVVQSENAIKFTWVLEGEKLEYMSARNYDVSIFEEIIEIESINEELIMTPHSKYATLDDEEIEMELLKAR